MTRFVVISLCAATLAACTPPTPETPPPAETKDRVDVDSFRPLLAAPLAAANADQFTTAAAGFDAVLRDVAAKRGPNSLAVADTLSAIGVALFQDSHKAEGLAYLNRAVDAYRRAVGPDSPEVAVALHDVINVRLDIDPEAAPPDLIALTRETLRIRRLKLGDANGETAVTYILLGRLTGAPDITKGDRARVDQAVADIRFGLAQLQKIPGAKSFDLNSGRFRLAEVYARNGRGPETLAAAADYWNARDMSDPLDEALRKAKIETLAEDLAARGAIADAAALQRTYLRGGV